MRRVSRKRAQRQETVHEWRAAFREELGYCELCGRSGPILHEISRDCDRARSLCERSCILGLCWEPCHSLVGSWPRSKQLALIKIKRPGDFNLEVFYRITARRWPYLEDIESHERELRQQLRLGLRG